MTPLASAWNFIEEKTLAQLFSYEFSEIYKNTFSIVEHLRWLLLFYPVRQ